MAGSKKQAEAPDAVIHWPGIKIQRARHRGQGVVAGKAGGGARKATTRWKGKNRRAAATAALLHPREH